MTSATSQRPFAAHFLRALAAALLYLGHPAMTSAQEGVMPSEESAKFGAVRGDRASGWLAQTRSEVLARNGLVTTSQPLAAQAGLQILQKGGNAFDAAVATAAGLNVGEPGSG